MLDHCPMPKFQLEVPHTLALPEVRKRLDGAIPKLERDYSARFSWEAEDRLVVARKGLNAVVNVEPTRLKIDLDMGFLLTPLSGTIRDGITRQLSELLA
jgi:putative polyhydroxyalkanoate system protein